jgi:hypothetical protein
VKASDSGQQGQVVGCLYSMAFGCGDMRQREASVCKAILSIQSDGNESESTHECAQI